MNKPVPLKAGFQLLALSSAHCLSLCVLRLLSLAAVVDRDSNLAGLLDGEAEVGLLVEFKKVQKTGLALVTDRDGKRNWKAVDARQGLAAIHQGCDVRPWTKR